MKKNLEFFKAMLLGGILFFIPLIILIVIIQKAFQITAVLVSPIIKLLDMTDIFGIGGEIIISVVIILFIIYLGGLISRSSRVRRNVKKIEDALLSKVPGYEMIKNMGESFVGFEGNTTIPTVLARIEDAWQFAFLIEEIEGEQCAVYIPGAPNPMSGSVYILEKTRIKKTNIPLKDVMKSLRGLGVGSNNLVKEYFL
jgi:uncharacterized membrane protein